MEFFAPGTGSPFAWRTGLWVRMNFCRKYFALGSRLTAAITSALATTPAATITSDKRASILSSALLREFPNPAGQDFRNRPCPLIGVCVNLHCLSVLRIDKRFCGEGLVQRLAQGSIGDRAGQIETNLDKIGILQGWFERLAKRFQERLSCAACRKDLSILVKNLDVVLIAFFVLALADVVEQPSGGVLGRWRIGHDLEDRRLRPGRRMNPA